jgi:hypothetical protein
MVKHSKRYSKKRNTSSKKRNTSSKRRNHKKGGGNYTSASSYGNYVDGDLNSQYNRTFSQTGPNAANQSNILTGVQGQNMHFIGTPSSSQLSTIQRAGRRRRRRNKKSKRGGFLGEIINQAIVPFSILGLQQSYRRKKNTGKKSRKYRGH